MSNSSTKTLALKPLPSAKPVSHPNLQIVFSEAPCTTIQESSIDFPILQAVYFFAGDRRSGDIGFWLDQICWEQGFRLEMQEFDLLRNPAHDLSVIETQAKWISELDLYNFVICTPPCSGHSRIQWANKYGPHPVRSAMWPRGFPWLSRVDRKRAAINDNLIDFTWKVFKKIDVLKQTRPVIAFGEHPEDLGRVRSAGPGAVPASIWRAEEFLSLIKNGWWSGAFRQDAFGAPTAKPTRGIASCACFNTLAQHALPEFDAQGFYNGPVTKSDSVSYTHLTLPTNREV